MINECMGSVVSLLENNSAFLGLRVSVLCDSFLLDVVAVA